MERPPVYIPPEGSARVRRGPLPARSWPCQPDRDNASPLEGLGPPRSTHLGFQNSPPSPELHRHLHLSLSPVASNGGLRQALGGTWPKLPAPRRYKPCSPSKSSTTTTLTCLVSMSHWIFDDFRGGSGSLLRTPKAISAVPWFHPLACTDPRIPRTR
jgi:hypothetical protein